MKPTIDKELLPMKAHYFLFNAGKLTPVKTTPAQPPNVQHLLIFPTRPKKVINVSTGHRLHQPISAKAKVAHARAGGG